MKGFQSREDDATVRATLHPGDQGHLGPTRPSVRPGRAGRRTVGAAGTTAVLFGSSASPALRCRRARRRAVASLRRPSQRPRETLSCLLYTSSMRLLRNSRLGGRLHVLISIRDLVFFSVFQSEHASRYIGDSHVFVLDWGQSSARAFLEAKLRRLPRDLTDGNRVDSLAM